ncbi:benzoylformate decarboxylase [Nocardiopsis trehalosi]|jgi:benzoylformate decarboxylase|uniref:benzoylformate decarboxylase n=1 Tax=Nocardiopsis trehalosi TaxID=109329 RepID=UPI000829F6CC|nr:benzoylformate decarboxylase [Nocardiopsis trehalosi]
MTATGGSPRTVRDATFDVLREYGLTTVFANPGSTEITFLTDLPEDLRLVLALHEGSVVGMATGWAIAHDRPALVQLHTTAGLGNAVGALATARVNRAPLVVLVGQQDRRHLALQPFLTGRLRDLAGDYPVWTDEPATAQDVPGAVARARHEAVHGRGPAIVIVPMDDWARPAEDGRERAAATRVVRAAAVDPEAVADVADLLDGARSPALVTGAGTDTEDGWAALTALAERLDAPVYQESFGARAGFPQDHPLFAGFLPADRPGVRDTLAGHDAVLTVGAPVFRQYPYTEGPFTASGTRIALVTDDPAEAHHSPAETAVLAPIAPALRAVAARVAERPRTRPAAARAAAPEPPAAGEPLLPGHVLAALAARADADTVFVEETPSSRPDMHRLVPARRPLGFLSAAMGGLGFAVPAAIGVRMARPDRPVIAVVGDGSSLYQVQALWSAAHYGTGVLFVVLANGRYAVMDRLAERHGGKPSWPGFEEVSLSGLARALGCPARTVRTHDDLTAALDEVVPTLRDRTEPVVLDIAVAAERTFRP